MGEGSGWFMAIMEWFDGTSLDQAWIELSDQQRKQVKELVERGVAILHREQIVFGDLRRPNILTKEEGTTMKGVLCDFDWCGAHGIGRYPSFMNHDGINWPEGVSDGCEMEKRHDLDWVNSIFESQSQSIGSRPQHELSGIH